MFDIYRQVVETGEPHVEPNLWYEDVWGDGTRKRRAFDIRATKLQDGFVVVAREVTEVREQEAALARQHGELERSNVEIRHPNELAELLQACVTPEEAYSVVAHSAVQLSAGLAGSVSITHPSRDLVESSVVWGDVAVGQLVFVRAIAGHCGGVARTFQATQERAVTICVIPTRPGVCVYR